VDAEAGAEVVAEEDREAVAADAEDLLLALPLEDLLLLDRLWLPLREAEHFADEGELEPRFSGESTRATEVRPVPLWLWSLWFPLLDEDEDVVVVVREPLFFRGLLDARCLR
jgi:hypothetical protein